MAKADGHSISSRRRRHVSQQAVWVAEDVPAVEFLQNQVADPAEAGKPLSPELQRRLGGFTVDVAGVQVSLSRWLADLDRELELPDEYAGTTGPRPIMLELRDKLYYPTKIRVRHPEAGSAVLEWSAEGAAWRSTGSISIADINPADSPRARVVRLLPGLELIALVQRSPGGRRRGYRKVSTRRLQDALLSVVERLLRDNGPEGFAQDAVIIGLATAGLPIAKTTFQDRITKDLGTSWPDIASGAWPKQVRERMSKAPAGTSRSR
jgi:hypothetical protein